MPSSGNGTDPLAHVRPGDAADDTLCRDQHGPWNCTRDLQHPGQHIAAIGYGQHVGAVWPATSAAPLDTPCSPESCCDASHARNAHQAEDDAEPPADPRLRTLLDQLSRRTITASGAVELTGLCEALLVQEGADQ